MRLVFFGSGGFGCPSLRRLCGGGHEVLRVVTQPARPGGRGHQPQPTEIARLSSELALPCVEAAAVNEPALLQDVTALRPEALVVIAFGQKLQAGWLRLPGCRAINLHASLLPKYRGAAPIHWAIINGERETGVTVIELNEVWDGGAILGRRAMRIRPGETAGELHDRLAELGPELLLEVLEQMARGQDRPQPQDERQASRAPKLRKSDAALNWSQPAERVVNWVQGTWPWPGAYSTLRQTNGRTERVTFARAKVAESSGSTGDSAAGEPGSVAPDLNICCRPGRLRPLEVQPDNGRLMSYEEYARGRHLQAGDRFEAGQA